MPNDMSPAASATSSSPTTISDPTPASPISPGSDTGGSASPSPAGYDRISGETSNDPDEVFSGLGGDFDELESLPEIAPTKPAATAPLPQVSAAQPPTAQAAQPPATPPAATAAAPDAAAQVPATAAPEAAPATQTDVPPAEIDQLLTALDERAADVLQQVAPQFQLTPEQITELETDAAAAVPKLLANTYLKTIKTVMSMVKEVVPSAIQQTMARTEAAREMETAFFKQWNLLDRTKHGNDIRMFAQTFAAANPRITQAELFSLVGAAVMAKHGLSANAAAAAPASPSPSFTPAVASAPVTHQKPVGESSPFAGMGFHFDDE